MVNNAALYIPMSDTRLTGNTTPAEPLSTREEDLLMALLAANAELIEALQLYDDLERVAIDREAEVQSRGEVWVDIT
jgi:hypothetical protein